MPGCRRQLEGRTCHFIGDCFLFLIKVDHCRVCNAVNRDRPPPHNIWRWRGLLLQVPLNSLSSGFQDVVWRRPITVNGVAHPTVIHLYQEKEAISYEVTSSSSVVNGEPGVCSEGLVLVGENHKAPESIAIQSIRSRCGSLCSAEEIYAAFHQHGIDDGPRFRTIRQVFTNGAEALATFSCPQMFWNLIVCCRIPRPWIAALQVLRGLAAGSDGDGTYVPFNVANVRLHGATPATGYIYARFLRAANRATGCLNMTSILPMNAAMYAWPCGGIHSGSWLRHHKSL